jgi:hypothetical protein
MENIMNLGFRLCLLNYFPFIFLFLFLTTQILANNLKHKILKIIFKFTLYQNTFFKEKTKNTMVPLISRCYN